MNTSTEKAPDEIRSDIEDTRRRMDDTMDALGNRLQPKHLLDEVVGYFRSEGADGAPRFNQLRDKVAHSANTVVHSVVDGVKKNPVPVLLIGAGVAWMIYASRRERSGVMARPPSSSQRYLEENRYDSGSPYDHPLEYSSSGSGSESGRRSSGDSSTGQWTEEEAGDATSAARTVKDKLTGAGDAVSKKAGEVRDAAGEKLREIKNGAREITSRVQESTARAYAVTRDRIVQTADRHPLEVGLVALAAGVLAGLALPTPNIVNRQFGATADRLRQRTRDAGSEMLEKGARVAKAAVTAVKDEAGAQGLTADTLGQKVTAIVDRAKQAGQESANREGLTDIQAARPDEPGPGTPARS